MNDPVADAAGSPAIIRLATADARQAIRDTAVEHPHDATTNWRQNRGTA